MLRYRRRITLNFSGETYEVDKVRKSLTKIGLVWKSEKCNYVRSIKALLMHFPLGEKNIFLPGFNTVNYSTLQCIAVQCF